MNVIFLGPPGSGKGTQAKQLAESDKLSHLSTGDLFRDAITNKTEMGLEIKAYVESGKLVPDELVSKLVFEKLKSLPKESGFLLDGYPRTVDQAKSLDKFGQQEKIGIDAVVFFDVAFPELVKRLSARRQCPKCKDVYNLVNRPPKKEGVCDNCGTALIHRPDDKAEVVQERLHVYTLQTEPLLKFYEGRPGYHKIDAAQDVAKVNAAIATSLKSSSGKRS